MKKKVSIILLLVAAMVLSMVGCGTVPSSSAEKTPVADLTAVNSVATASTSLQFEAKGHYNMPGFGEEYFVYQFDSPNDNIVLYKIGDSIYILGDAESDTSYCGKVMNDSQFIALSEKYLLFITPVGKLAVAIEEKDAVNIGDNIYQMYFFDDLSDEEKSEFIYPASYKKVTQ